LRCECYVLQMLIDVAIYVDRNFIKIFAEKNQIYE